MLLYLGQTIPLLMVARLLQGISAAVVWTIGLALLLDTVGSKKLGVYIGSIFGFISIGELAAPVLGGVVYERVGSGGVFAMGFALLGIDFLMRLLVIEKKTARRYNSVSDNPPAPNDDSTSRDEENGEQQTEEDPLLQGKKEDHQWKIPSGQSRWIRKLPILYCLSNPRLIVAQLVAFMQATLLATFDATIPTEAQSLFGFDSLKAGLLFAPLVLPYLLLGPVAGKLVDKYGPKPAAVLGFAFEVPALILLRIPQPGGTVQIVIFCILAALNGVGLGAIGSPSIVEASYVCDGYFNANKEFFGGEGPYAQLYAINSMVRIRLSILVPKSNTDPKTGIQRRFDSGSTPVRIPQRRNRLRQHERGGRRTLPNHIYSLLRIPWRQAKAFAETQLIEASFMAPSPGD